MAICILHPDGDWGFSALVNSHVESEGMEIVPTLAQPERELHGFHELHALRNPLEDG